VGLVVRERNGKDAGVANCELECEERRKVQLKVAAMFGTDEVSRDDVI
jgi:hypothetical protein